MEGVGEGEIIDTVSPILYLKRNHMHYSHSIFRAASVHKKEEIGPGVSDSLSKATLSLKGQGQDLNQLL